MLISGCNSQSKPEQIVSIKDIAAKSLTEVEEVLGQSEKVEEVKGYPCEYIECQRAYFQNGKYEIIFKKGKANRITIYQVPDLTSNKNAITSLGLLESDPDFSNPSLVIRWKYTEGIDEISFFPDYILIDVNKLPL